jgi:hypothetical protein
MPLLLLASCLLQKQRTPPPIENWSPPGAHAWQRVHMRSSEFDDRTGRQILESARDYCNWRSTRGKHGSLTHIQRFHHDRLWYLNGVTGITDAMYAPRPVAIAIALPVLDPAPTLDPRCEQLAGLPRAELVRRLMAADSSLTSKKLLLGLQKFKLAGLLCAALDSTAVEVRPQEKARA